MEDKCECGMPLSDKASCKCNPKLCLHCCACDENCDCKCNEKAKANK